MGTRLTRTPLPVKRGKGGTGGDLVPTVEGVLQHRDYVLRNLASGQEKLAEWSTKEKRAKQQRDGICVHAELRFMTALQLDRYIKHCEGEFWIASRQVDDCNEELARLNRLLR